MTMFEKIKAMDLDEMVLFICNVSEGILDEEYDLTTCSGKSFADICNGEIKYDKAEFVKDYLMSLDHF